MALIAKTRPQAALVLADGTVFQGESTGAAGLTVGEVVFNTSMTGYQEILTDPSYTGQLVTLTCAHIGNVGVNPEDMESNAIHAAGLIVVLWIYPRGKAVTDEKDPDLIAGAAGVALCLGADFVKVNPPHDVEGQTSAESLKIASMAAGRTGLVCAGGSKADANVFLTQLHDQIHIGGACGNATGRNIHMRSDDEAIRLCNAISAITLGDWSVEDAEAVFRGEKEFSL